MGHLNDNPKSESTANGKKLTIFYIATNEFVKNADGEKIKRTDWHKVTTYGKTADNCEKMLQKGSFVLVEGKIRNKANKDDVRSSYEILATEVSFISGYKSKEVSEACNEHSN
jgi:single-strand DNA-binding protein